MGGAAHERAQVIGMELAVIGMELTAVIGADGGWREAAPVVTVPRV